LLASKKKLRRRVVAIKIQFGTFSIYGDFFTSKIEIIIKETNKTFLRYMTMMARTHLGKYTNPLVEYDSMNNTNIYRKYYACENFFLC
jgi:hypothetical protein